MKLDKEKFKKINWKRLEKHPIVEYFIQNPNEEELFRGNLRAYREDTEFLSILGVNSLGDEDIEWLINEIKDRYITRKTTRRSFLKWLGIGVASAGGAFAAKRYGLRPFKSNLPDKVIETKILDDFLTYTEKDSIDKRRIETLLYDIVNKRTRGRAVHIGDGYFLTAYHVVKGVETSHKLVPQSIRYRNYAKDFKILYYDSDADIALLKASVDNREGKSLVHLSPRILRIGENVLLFTRLSGSPLSQSYEYEIYGKDYYDEKSDMKIGKFSLQAGSLLFETQGFVLVKNDSLILKDVIGVDEISKKSLKYNQFTSLMMYQGDSGSPVFLRLGVDRYVLAGIATSALGIQHKIITPNHPLKYKGMQQTGASFAHRDSIEKFIMNYNSESKKM